MPVLTAKVSPNYEHSKLATNTIKMIFMTINYIHYNHIVILASLFMYVDIFIVLDTLLATQDFCVASLFFTIIVSYSFMCFIA